MRFRFSPATSSARSIAIIDIGSGSVGAAILSYVSGACTVHAAARVTLSLEERTARQLHTDILSAVSETLGRTLADARKNKTDVSIGEVMTIVHAPWSTSEVIVEKEEFEKETKITDKLIHALAQKALAGGEKTGDKKATTLIESFLMRVELNGYPAAKPEGKHAKFAAVSILVSHASKSFTDGVTKAIAAHIPGANMCWRSAARTRLVVMRESGIAPDAYVIADVEEEATDFAIVEHGIIRSMAPSALGQRVMLTQVSPKGLPEDTLASVRHVSADDCDDKACDAIKENMAKAEGGLARLYGEALGKDLPRSRLPNTLVVLAHPDLTPWLTRFFTRIDFSQFTTTMQPFSVMTLPDIALAKISGKAPPAFDTDLKLGATLVTLEKR